LVEQIKEIDIFMPSLGGGGAEKIVIKLMEGLLDEGIGIKLILATKSGVLRDEIPEGIQIIDLNHSKTVFSLFSLTSYLRCNRPRILLSHLHRANRIAILANILTGRKTKVFIVEHNTISVVLKQCSSINRILLKFTYKYLYPKSDMIIHVSKAAANDLERLFGWKSGTVKVAYNPVIRGSSFSSESKVKPPHPWMGSNQCPVILGVGRLTRQKNFLLLIEAFAKLREIIDCRLIILGEGEDRDMLKSRILELRIADYVDMPGFVRNSLDYMTYASVFVLSSEWEALPTVLIEALASGCPVVSTDCPSGPLEILENGKFGILVQLNDPEKLAESIKNILVDPPERNNLKKRGMEFSIKNATTKYIELFESK
jgi:glycosyltransferase involved in cell wall biosynthesis